MHRYTLEDYAVLAHNILNSETQYLSNKGIISVLFNDTPINDFESMIVNEKISEIKADKTCSKIAILTYWFKNTNFTLDFSYWNFHPVIFLPMTSKEKLANLCFDQCQKMVN